MDIRDAAYHTVHDYPGGSSSLAPRLGKRPGVLCHEVAPPEGSSAKLGLVDALRIVQMTGDARILAAFAVECGHMVVPLPAQRPEPLPHDARAAGEHLAEVAREFADVMAAASMALADGRVCENERRSIERQFGELIAAGQAMLGMFSALASEQRGRIGVL